MFAVGGQNRHPSGALRSSCPCPAGSAGRDAPEEPLYAGCPSRVPPGIFRRAPGSPTRPRPPQASPGQEFGGLFTTRARAPDTKRTMPDEHNDCTVHCTSNPCRTTGSAGTITQTPPATLSVRAPAGDEVGGVTRRWESIASHHLPAPVRHDPIGVPLRSGPGPTVSGRPSFGPTSEFGKTPKFCGRLFLRPAEEKRPGKRRRAPNLHGSRPSTNFTVISTEVALLFPLISAAGNRRRRRRKAQCAPS